MREVGRAVEREGTDGTAVGPRADRIAVAILAVAISIFFLDVILGTGTFYYRDLVYGGYPTRAMLRETIVAGEFPHWNRWIGAGQPMAANPAYQVFYPPVALILLPNLTYGFNLYLLLHIYIAALGTYALLRSMDAGPAASAVAAFSFALSAVVAVHDLIPVLTTLVWLPWTCLFARRFLRDGRQRDFALAALFFGIQVLLGEATVVLQTGMILGFYALMRPRKLRSVGIVGLLCVAAVLLAMVQVLPAADLARDSVRARGFPFDRVVSWSMPFARLGELVNPNFLGHQMLNGRAVYWGSELYGVRGLPFVRSIYPGILMSILAIAGVIAGVRGRRLVMVLFGLAVVLAIGVHTPLWRWLYDIGLARSVRYPEKFILMGLFAVIVFGARVLDRILDGDERTSRVARRTCATVAVILGTIALFSLTALYAPLFIRMWNPSSRMFAEMLPASRSAWLLAAGRALLLFILLRNLGRVRRTLGLALLGTLVLLDLGQMVPELAPRMPREYFDETPRIGAEFKRDYRDCRLLHVAAWEPGGAYRTQQPDQYWIARNALFPMMPASWGIATVLEPELDNTYLLPTADFIEAVSKLARSDPAWLEKTAAVANACAAAIFEDPARAYAAQDRTRVQPVHLVRLPPSPRYFLTPGHAGSVRHGAETPNTARISAESTKPAFLFMSVTPHKYWRITIDGKEVQPTIANIGFQRVPVPAGKHVVEMRYRNPLFAIGGVVSLLTLLALLWRMR